MYMKNYNLKKEVGIAIKSKQTSNQLEPVTRYTYAPSSCIGYCYNSKPNDVQIKHSLAHLQDLIPTLACVLFVSAKVGIKSYRYS